MYPALFEATRGKNVNLRGQLQLDLTLLNIFDAKTIQTANGATRWLTVIAQRITPLLCLAWVAQTALAWIVLPLSYLLTPSRENVNWVYGPGSRPQKQMPPLVYLGLVMLVFSVVFYLPAHLVLKLFFRS